MGFGLMVYFLLMVFSVSFAIGLEQEFRDQWKETVKEEEGKASKLSMEYVVPQFFKMV